MGPTFVKTFSVTRDAKTFKFKTVQEAARKDSERALGVLQEANMVRSWVKRCDLHVRKAKELRDRKTQHRSTYYRSSERVSDFGDYGGNTQSSGFGKFGSDCSSGFGNFSSAGAPQVGHGATASEAPRQDAIVQCLLTALLCQIMSRFHRSLEIVENDGYTKKLCLELQHLQVARELPSLSILSSLAVYYVNLTKYSNL
ncbi:ALP1-like protein isoform X1 [Tanacetum coccineum]|uniref:ALP1-like protein isoform X1 n=1 Tax=Tanacetum coccineum TaxID=301880 RepID=A0ABQ5D3E1_9ASTR